MRYRPEASWNLILPLRKWNEQASVHPLARYIGVTVFCVALAAYLVHYAEKYGLNVPPSATGDEPSYDSLGWEMSHGRGYQIDFDNPDFRRPYDLKAEQQPQLFSLPELTAGPTTYRPPGFPAIIACTDLLFGRQYWAVRILNAAAMAATCGLLVQFLFRHLGMLPALIGAVTFVLIDYRTRLYGRAILTEAFALLFVTILTLALVSLSNSTRPNRLAIGTGVVAGMLVLVRTMFVFWLPAIAVLMYFLVPTSLAGEFFKKKRFVPPAIFVAVSLLVITPWMIRNCVVLGAVRPLGTQGMIELSAGYSDQAVQSRGVWMNLWNQGFFDGVVTPEMSSLEIELARANYSSQLAFQWIRENTGKAAVLVPMKIYQEFRPRTAGEWFVFLFAILGYATAPSRQIRIVFGALLLINAAAVGVTWSVAGRFLVPLLFIFHALAVSGIWYLLTRASSRQSQ